MSDGFPERLRVAVKNAGGVGELARKSGVAARTISGYLAGKGDPARQRLVALAEAGEVSVGWLATGCDHQAAVVAEAAPPYLEASPDAASRHQEVPPMERYRRALGELEEAIGEAGYEPDQAVRQAILTVMFRYGLPKQGAADMLEFFRPVSGGSKPG